MSRIPVGGFLLAMSLSGIPAGRAAEIRLAGDAAVLSVGSVSERTVRIAVAPLDDMGKPRSGAASTVLVVSDPKPLFTARELPDSQQIDAGKLRVRVKPAPLTITVLGPGDSVVQEFAFADDGAMTFLTPAPVLGLGEGARQFDRRGGYYRMVN